MSSIIKYSLRCSLIIGLCLTIVGWGIGFGWTDQPLQASGGSNIFVNPDFVSDVSGWQTKNIASGLTINGYVLVPGSEDYGTDDFYAMQYEAKYDCTDDGIGDTAAACSAAADSGLGLDWRDTDRDRNKVVSTPEGAPIVHATWTQASTTVCPVGTHLITNNEWMTIARNAEAQSQNWANGVVGSLVSNGGGMFRGNVGTNDSASYNGPDPEQGTGRNTKARLALSNGAQLWDISGNVWEWVNFDGNDNGIYGEPADFLSQQEQPEATDGESTRAPGYAWSGFTSADPVSTWYLANNGSGSWDYDDFRPADSSLSALNGVGRIYHTSDSSNTTKNLVVRRGGHWLNGSDAGAFTAIMSVLAGDQNNTIGLRCASDSVGISQAFAASDGHEGGGGQAVETSTFWGGLVSQSLTLTSGKQHTMSVMVKTADALDEDSIYLMAGDDQLETDYVALGDDWYLLEASLVGAGAVEEYGLYVGPGNQMVTDNWVLAEVSTPTPTPTPTQETKPALTIAANHTFTKTSDVVLTGTAPAGATVEVRVYSTEQIGVVVANSSGQWLWTPPLPLDPGVHHYIARLVLDDGYGPFSDPVYFEVLGASDQIPDTGYNQLGLQAIGWVMILVGGGGLVWVRQRAVSSEL